MAGHMYDIATQKLTDGSFTWLSSTIKALLVTSSYTYSSGHTAITSATAAELTDASYSRKTLATKTLTLDSGNHRAVLSSANVTFPSLAGAANPDAMIIYADPGTGDANCVPLLYCDFTAFAPTGADAIMQPNATTGWGIITAS